jgi:hypothetical protein
MTEKKIDKKKTKIDWVQIMRELSDKSEEQVKMLELEWKEHISLETRLERVNR